MNTSLSWVQSIGSRLKPSLNLLGQTLALRAFAFKNIPLIFLVRPSVLKLDKEECEIKIPLNFITKNHLNSMYFGALSIGADIVGGLLTMHLIRQSSHKIQMVFKDVRANFIRRPEAEVHFSCKEGRAIQRQILKTLQTQQRTHQKLKIIATTPSLSKNKPVAEFELTLSLKAKA